MSEGEGEGERGRDGATGAEGRAGTTGREGSTGSTGAEGSTGGEGPRGAAGARGERGREGVTGAEGRAGTTGAEGHIGATGEAGAAGAQGPRGRYGAAGFLILMTFCFAGFLAVDRQGARSVQADRDGCEDVNVLRVNQARNYLADIRQTERALRGELGPLRQFRGQAQRGVTRRKDSLRRLRESVQEHPLQGKAALLYPRDERRYRIDCVRAYPG